MAQMYNKLIREVFQGRDPMQSIGYELTDTGVPSDTPTTCIMRYQEADTSWWCYSIDSTAWLPLNDDAKTLYDATV